MSAHVSVMLRETIEALAPRSGGVYADTTLGRAGHAEMILEASAPDGWLIGIDRDLRAIEEARPKLARFGARARLVHGEMAELSKIVADQGAERVHGVLADLGVSSPQLDVAERGFSFRLEGPLDMRMDTSRGETARELCERLREEQLADVIYELGEERKSRPIARSIKRAIAKEQLVTTLDLRRAVVSAIGPQRGKIDPATRTFQALRLAVNGELDQLTALLEQLPDVLEDHGRAAILSFHSLEDRLVKRAFRGDARLAPLTKRPLVPSDDECRENPRARSAKLRTCERAPREEDAA